MIEFKDKNLYYVGGVVRDEFLGVSSLDTDYCYEGNAIKFCNENYKEYIIKSNPDFGTVRLSINEREIDIASTREESYPNAGHLPVVHNIGCSLITDLKRRDFTINAMARNTQTGNLVDYFNGKFDIENGLIRVLHKNSFIDDPTRILRALKFSVRFGFELCEETKFLQDEYLFDINYDISYHRLKKELIETFNLNSSDAFDKFNKYGIYKLLGDKQVLPNVKGRLISENCIKYSVTDNIWLIYMSFYNLSNLDLTKKEKNILLWADRLKTECACNNTPKESIVINNIRKEL